MKSTIRESSSSETLDGTREAKRKFRWESISRPWTKRKKRRVSRNRIRNREIGGYINRFVEGLVSRELLQRDKELVRGTG